MGNVYKIVFVYKRRSIYQVFEYHSNGISSSLISTKMKCSSSYCDNRLLFDSKKYNRLCDSIDVRHRLLVASCNSP